MAEELIFQEIENLIRKGDTASRAIAVQRLKDIDEELDGLYRDVEKLKQLYRETKGDE